MVDRRRPHVQANIAGVGAAAGRATHDDNAPAFEHTSIDRR
jgi:hypothetical protein